MISEPVLLVAWGLWCILHSLLIANPVLAFLRRRLGRAARFHRLAYVGFSLVTLAPLIHLTRSLDREVVVAWEGLWRLIPVGGVIVAGILFLAGGLSYSAAQFLGFRQALGGELPEAALETSGVLNLVRHPWYTATFLLLWSRDLTALWLQVNGLLSVYLVVGTLLEERKLVQAHGERYRAYQRRVSMFVPVKWLLAKGRSR